MIETSETTVRIAFICFITFMVSCSCAPISILSQNFNNPSNDRMREYDQNKSLNSHFFKVLVVIKVSVCVSNPHWKLWFIYSSGPTFKQVLQHTHIVQTIIDCKPIRYTKWYSAVIAMKLWNRKSTFRLKLWL